MEQEALKAEIGRLRSQVEEGTSEKYEHLLDNYARLLNQVDELKSRVEVIQKIHDKATIRALRVLGGGAQAASDLTALLNDVGAILVSNDYTLRLPREAAAIIERKRDKAANPKKRRETILKLAEDFPDDETVQNLAVPLMSFSGRRRGGMTMK